MLSIRSLIAEAIGGQTDGMDRWKLSCHFFCHAVVAAIAVVIEEVHPWAFSILVAINKLCVFNLLWACSFVQHFWIYLWPNKPSLVPRPSTPPVFDHLQYAKTEGEGLGNFIMWSTARPSKVVTPPLNSQVIYETDLASVLAIKMGQAPAESYTKRMKHTQDKSHDSERLQSDGREIPSSDAIIS